MIRLSKCAVSEKEIAAVNSVLNNEYLGMGPEVQAFEQELQSFLGGQVGVACVCNGTAALQLALQAAGVGTGDEVLLPTLTYLASFQAVSALGATPVACDVNEADGLLSLQEAEKCVNQRSKAIMPVHYTGNAGDLTAVYGFAKKYNLRVIEDAAHAFGGLYQDKLIGSFGDIACFSFDGIKNITSGEGGAIVSSDQALISKIKDLRLLGVEKDSEQRYVKQRSWDFDVKAQGWRYHMSDIMAAIGRVQLRRFSDEFAPQRIALMNHYRESLAVIDGIKLFSIGDKNKIVPHIMPIKVAASQRDALREYLLQKEVQVGIHYKPNHLLTKYAKPGLTLPIAEKLYAGILTLPLHVDLTLAQADEVVGYIKKFMEVSS